MATTSPEAKAKRKATLLHKFGVDNSSKIPGNNEKRKATCIAKYGKEHFYQTGQWREEVQKSNLEKHGVNWFFQTAEAKNKTRQTCLARYGSENAMCNPDIKARLVASCMEKYGETNASKSPEVISRILSTKQAKYGTTAPIGVGQEEERIRAWLTSIGVPTIKNHTIILGKELDFYSADHKVAIEYNGLFWHCERFNKDRTSHYNKWKTCRDSGVRLITVFEDEWLGRQEQVKNFLKSVFGKNRKVFGRNCSVSDVPRQEAESFLDRTHIQGAPHTFRYAAGLYSKEKQLLGVMTFGKHHRGGQDTILSRLSFEDGVSVVGGSSKLFKYLTKKYDVKKVVSWSDNRWSSGKVYEALGFSVSARLPADYSYVDTTTSTPERKSKQSKKKSLTGCPKDVKEADWCKASGLYRIWDCGKIRWEWNKPNEISTATD